MIVRGLQLFYYYFIILEKYRNIFLEKYRNIFLEKYRNIFLEKYRNILFNPTVTGIIRLGLV